MANIDGYQVFKKAENGLFSVAPCRGSFREAVEDKLHLRAIDGEVYEIHSIINNNNNK